MIVIVGGTAGVIAAIQAGRAGARTLLVEKSGMFGGTMTLGGVSAPGIFFAWKRQVIAGIGWELVTRCLHEVGQEIPASVLDSGQPHWRHHIPIDGSIFTALCDEAVVESGAEILFHAMIAGVAPAEGGKWTVTLCTKKGLAARVARVVIDATGDANAAALAGFPLEIPSETQPATLSWLGMPRSSYGGSTSGSMGTRPGRWLLPCWMSGRGACRLLPHAHVSSQCLAGGASLLGPWHHGLPPSAVRAQCGREGRCGATRTCH